MEEWTTKKKKKKKMVKPKPAEKDVNITLINLSSSTPSSPSSSSSSDFEFTISLSPTSRSKSTHLCPADELFYKGQLLPLHLSPRLSMVRTLLASSSTSSSSDTTTTASRDSTGSNSSSDSSSFSHDLLLLAECDSSRPSNAIEDDHCRKLPTQSKKSKYFSLSIFSSVFLRKENKNAAQTTKKVTSSAKEVIRKYVKKVKPLYEKLSSKQQQQERKMGSGVLPMKMLRSAKQRDGSVGNGLRDGGSSFSHSFSGNLRYPRRRSIVSSCPSSMRSSPTHSGVLRGGAGFYSSDSSSMEELQSAIQGAIAHCKNSMGQVSLKKVNEI